MEVETRDISLSAWILAVFSDAPEDQKTHDALAELGQLAKTPEANIVKLPNISASIPQLKSAIAELRLGIRLAGLPRQREHCRREGRQSALRQERLCREPVLREGNSDRRAPKAVKAYAKKHQHRMGAWAADSKARVASMSEGDFFVQNKASPCLPPRQPISCTSPKTAPGRS